MRHCRLRCIVVLALCLAQAASSASAGARELLRETFDQADGKLPAGWRTVRGQWRVEEGALVADALKGEAYVLVGDETWENYEVEVTATFLKVREPSRWLSIVFRAPADGSTPWSQFPIRQKATARNGTEFAVRATPKRWSVRATGKAKADSQLGQPRRLRVAVRGTKVEGFLDGQRVIESPFCVDRETGCVGLGVSGCVARFDDLVVRALPKAPKPPPAVEHPERCLCVAHRGFSASYPENTLLAVMKGIEAGADGIEFDVYNSSDRVPVLMHDKTVKRTTDGTGEVKSLSLAQLKKLDAGSWKGKRFAGEPVPTLLDVLRKMKATKARAMIEIKPDGIAREVVEAVREAGMVGQSVAISFSDKACADVHALEPKLPVSLVVGGKPKGGVRQQADSLCGRAAKCGAKILDLNFQMLSPELVAELRRRGFVVWCWTVDDAVLMDTLARWGVEAVTTDRPDLMTQWRREILAKAR